VQSEVGAYSKIHTPPPHPNPPQTLRRARTVFSFSCRLCKKRRLGHCTIVCSLSRHSTQPIARSDTSQDIANCLGSLYISTTFLGVVNSISVQPFATAERLVSPATTETASHDGRAAGTNLVPGISSCLPLFWRRMILFPGLVCRMACSKTAMSKWNKESYNDQVHQPIAICYGLALPGVLPVL